MQQLSGVYVKIITGTFNPMNLPVDYVWSVTSVIADYVIANGYAVLTDSEGTPI